MKNTMVALNEHRVESENVKKNNGSMSTTRTFLLKKELLGSHMEGSIERARLSTEAYRQNDMS